MSDNKINNTDSLTHRILVVDDDARLRSLLQRFLEDDGFVVRTAHDGSQMDKLMQRELFSLVVLDLMLPGEDGISICKRLREDNSDIPIIMLTAKGSDSDRIAGLEAGADDYLPKPFNPKASGSSRVWSLDARFINPYFKERRQRSDFNHR